MTHSSTDEQTTQPTEISVTLMRVWRTSETPGLLTRGTSLLPQPGPGEARIKVEACGVCRTDPHIIDTLGPEVLGRDMGGRAGLPSIPPCLRRSPTRSLQMPRLRSLRHSCSRESLAIAPSPNVSERYSSVTGPRHRRNRWTRQSCSRPPLPGRHSKTRTTRSPICGRGERRAPELWSSRVGEGSRDQTGW